MLAKFVCRIYIYVYILYIDIVMYVCTWVSARAHAPLMPSHSCTSSSSHLDLLAFNTLSSASSSASSSAPWHCWNIHISMFVRVCVRAYMFY